MCTMQPDYVDGTGHLPIVAFIHHYTYAWLPLLGFYAIDQTWGA